MNTVLKITKIETTETLGHNPIMVVHFAGANRCIGIEDRRGGVTYDIGTMEDWDGRPYFSGSCIYTTEADAFDAIERGIARLSA